MDVAQKGMSTRCECGRTFSVHHSLNCLKGVFPTLRHNKDCDLTASLLSEVQVSCMDDGACLLWVFVDTSACHFYSCVVVVVCVYVQGRV